MFDATTRQEIERIAARLLLDPAVLMAVAEVESSGKAYARIKGRNEPLIRFEGHYFDRLTKGKTRQRARDAGLAHPRAGEVKNPRTQRSRWALLQKAIAIDRPAALSSVSWGVGQVMGAHWNWLGYASIEALVVETRRDVAGQVALMTRFIDKAGLADSLRKRDWAGFARRYNGRDFRKNRYDQKLQKAFARYARSGLQDVARTTGNARLSVGSRGEGVLYLQRMLQKWGLRIRADGRFGPITRRQLEVAQKYHDLPASGVVTPAISRLIEKEAHSWRQPARKAGMLPLRPQNLKTRGLKFIAGAVSRLALFFWRRFT